MEGVFEWTDVFDEVRGASARAAPSPWDALSIVSRVAGIEMPVMSSRDVDLRTPLCDREGARRLDLPLVLADGGDGLLSPPARLALIQAAARTGCALRLSDPAPDYVELAQELGVALWVVLGPHRSASVVKAIQGAAVVELQLVEATPDGGIASSVDAWDGEGSLGKAVGTLRSVSGGANVYVNVGTASDRTTVRAAIASGADGVLVQARSRRSSVGLPVAGVGPMAAVAGLRRQSAFVSRPPDMPEPKHAVSGGFKDGTEVAKALALGADTIVLGTTVRIAIGCTLCVECGPGDCPRGPSGTGPNGAV